MILTTSNQKKRTMKKIFALGWMLVAALALTNCSKEETVAPTLEQDFVVYANLDATRTVADGYATSWADGDNLNIFHAVAGEATYVSDGEFTLTNVEAGTFEGTVTGVEDGTSYDWFAIYPYNSYSTTPANAGYMTIAALTQEQAGVNNTTHTSGAPLYGVVKGGSSVAPEFSMKHLSSMIKVNVTNVVDEAVSIKSILVETAGTKITGTYYVDITGDAPVYTSSGDTYTYTSAQLNVTGEVAVQPNETAAYYLTVCPFVVEEGATETITVTVTDNSDEVSVREYTIPAGKGFAPGKVTTLNFDFAADGGIEWTTIADIHAATAEGTYNIQNATVVAVGKYNSLLYDSTGYLYSYQNLGVAVGDVVNIMNATTSTYGERQIKEGATVEVVSTTTVEHPTPEVIADATAYNTLVSDYTVGQYVTIHASSLSIGSYLNFTVDGGSATGSFVTPSDTSELVALNGLPAKITGYVCYLNSSNFFYVFMTDIEALPYLTVDPTSLSWNATETTAKTATVSSDNENWTIDETTVPDWAEVVKTDATTLTVTPKAANEGATRTAKVVLKHATEDISEPVTLSQGEAGVETATATYTFSANGYTNSQSLNDTEIKLDDNITAIFNKGTGGTNPAYYNTGAAARLYGGNTLKIEGGLTITKITYRCSTVAYATTLSGFTYDSGSVQTSSADVVWTPSSATNSVTVTNPNSSGHVRIATILVEYTK